MGTYGYISIIAMVCYAFMLLMFLAAKRNKIVNSFLIVLADLLLWTGGSAFMRAQLWPQYAFWYQVSLFGILLLLSCGKYLEWFFPGVSGIGEKKWNINLCI